MIPTMKYGHWVGVAIASQMAFAAPSLAATFGYGELAAQETYYLSANLAGRSIGTPKEQEAVDYLSQRLADFGYEPFLQEFSFVRRGQTYTSYNIIAERAGTSGKRVIVGAHYDSAPSGTGLGGFPIDRSTLEGTNDNASGVGVLLELAARRDADTNHSYTFILFGAEEVGLRGSLHYASTLTTQDLNNTLGMINLDSLVFGDKMYFHAGRNATEQPELGNLRDLALTIASDLGIAAETNPGLNPTYPAGTGCCSDLEAFDELEPFIPVLAAEATNWDIGDLDGYTQTSDPRVPYGATWHETDTDNVAFINSIFPGLIEKRTRDYTLVLDTLLDELDTQGVPEPASLVGLLVLAGVGGLLSRPSTHPSRRG